jgi:hypothetical protein
MLRRASLACYTLVFWRLRKREQMGKFLVAEKFAHLHNKITKIQKIFSE